MTNYIIYNPFFSMWGKNVAKFAWIVDIDEEH